MKHVNLRIELTNGIGEQVGSLLEFNPTNTSDLNMVHAALDEYLGYLERRFEAGETGGNDNKNGFRIFDIIHED